MFLTDRRSFLMGTAGIITASFVATAQAWIEDAGEPLLLPPRAARETLWINHMGEQLLFSVGDLDTPQPDPPSWADYFKSKGHALDLTPEFRNLIEKWDLELGDLRKPMNEDAWATEWECNLDPTARAYSLLRDLDLGSGDGPGEWLGELNFMDGGHPGSSDRWVEAEDHLTVTLLQARLRELGSSIEVIPGARY